ncbi:UNVERIFIED_CONTAM: hypothetical protein HDU68_000759, partial [Siphonaria sp. JEL0065]
MARESTEDIVDLRDTYYYTNQAFAYANKRVITLPITNTSITTPPNDPKSSSKSKIAASTLKKRQIVSPTSTN